MSTISKFAGRVVCTKAQFDALAEKDPNKEYLVTDDDTHGGGSKCYMHDVSISDNSTPSLQPTVFFKYISKDNTKFSLDKLNFDICFDVTTSTTELPPKHYKVKGMVVMQGTNNLYIEYYSTYPYSDLAQTTITILKDNINITDTVTEL